MDLQLICFKFPTMKNAKAFADDLKEGQRQQGTTYVMQWESPRRRRNGYAVALFVEKPEKLDALSTFHRGERMALKPGASVRAAAAVSRMKMEAERRAGLAGK